jgi:hypothetical protein
MSLITRSDKGSPLTYNDMDQNLTYLESLNTVVTVLNQTNLGNSGNRTYSVSTNPTTIGRYRVCPYIKIITMTPPLDGSPQLELYLRYYDENNSQVNYQFGLYTSSGRHIYTPIDIIAYNGSNIEVFFEITDGTYNYNSSCTIQSIN